MSLSFFVRYLEKDMDSEIIFVGIEPESMDWADNPTERVENAAYEFIDALKECIL
jgi:hydrogenase 3 maturation protease